MTRVIAKYRSKVISRHPIQKFMVKIDNCKVELESRKQELTIQIRGKSGEEKTRKLLSDLENLIFFYLGSFPFMESLNINAYVWIGYIRQRYWWKQKDNADY